MTDERKREMRLLAICQVTHVLLSDHDGDEQIMKEVWEECDGDEEIAVVKDALIDMIAKVEELK